MIIAVDASDRSAKFVSKYYPLYVLSNYTERTDFTFSVIIHSLSLLIKIKSLYYAYRASNIRT